MTTVKTNTTERTAETGETGVPGLFYYQNAISPDAISELTKYFESIPDAVTKAQSNDCLWEKAGIANRRVLHYGYKYPYSRVLRLQKTHDIPEIIDRLLIQPLRSLIPVLSAGGVWTPDQVIVNRYHKGQGISAHTDHKKLFREPILCVSLGVPGTMVFKHQELENMSLITKSGSVYIMTGPARWEYTHEMVPNKESGARYSITFRNIDPQFII